MDRWNRFAHTITHHAGSKQAFGAVALLIAAWGVVGVVSGPSRGWELSVTCGVPIVTLLMVILLQHAQNRDSKAVQIKLNELLLALEEPNSEVIRAGGLGDEELDELNDRYSHRSHEEGASRAE